MNATLVICMLVAILGGIGSAVGVVISGWGWISAIVAYGLGGSITLVLTATLLSLASRLSSRAHSG